MRWAGITGGPVDDDDRPNAGEDISLTVKITNEGTVTLQVFDVAYSIESAGCTALESFLLGQGEQHECIAAGQVQESSCVRGFFGGGCL